MFTYVQSVDYFFDSVDEIKAISPIVSLELPPSSQGIIIDVLFGLAVDNLTSKEQTDYVLDVDNKTITFEVEDDALNIKYVSIDDRLYSINNDVKSLEDGEFFFDQKNKSLVVKNKAIVDGFNSIPSYIFRVAAKSIGALGIRTTNICNAAIEQLLLDFNALGEVVLNHRFRDHSSLTLSFVVSRDRSLEMEELLSEDVFRTAFGYNWIVDTFSITSDGVADAATVEIVLLDYLASRGNKSKSPLDKEFQVKDLVDYPIAPNNLVFLPTARVFYSPFTLTAGLVAEATGVTYTGIPVNKTINRDDLDTERVTLRQLLNERAIVMGGFVFYGLGVEVKPWDETSIHILEDGELRQNVLIEFNPHLTTISNAIIVLDFDDDLSRNEFLPNSGSGGGSSDDGGNNPPGESVRWIFENANSFADVITPNLFVLSGSRSASSEELRSPGANSDVGGRIKRATKITQLNGSIIETENWEYGYAFSSAEVYEIEIIGSGYDIKFKNDSPSIYWKEIKHTTTSYLYTDNNYLTAISTTGTQLIRLQQESEKLEAVNLLAESRLAGDDPLLLARSEAYLWSESVPISDITTYELGSFAAFFSDTVSSNPPAKFVRRKSRISQSSIIKDNPANTPDITYPPILYGKTFSEIEITTILNTAFPYKYEARYLATNSEGEYLKYATTTGNVTQYLGKPPIHTSINPAIDPFIIFGSNGNGDRGRFSSSTYTLNSTGEESTTIISYEGVSDPTVAKNIAETELSIENTLNHVVATINICWRDDLKVGDRLLFQGVLWLIISISDVREIRKGAFISTSMDLVLGKIVKSTVTLSQNQVQI